MTLPGQYQGPQAVSLNSHGIILSFIYTEYCTLSSFIDFVAMYMSSILQEGYRKLVKQGVRTWKMSQNTKISQTR